MRSSATAAVLFAVFAQYFASASEAFGAGITLAMDGKPAAVVVIPDDAGRRSVERGAAELLMSLVRQMSGAELPIKHERELDENGNLVLVGDTKMAGELGVTAEGLGIGGMRAKTTGNALVLLGGPEGGPAHSDPNGVRYAVIEVLELLGCRYLWPGELGKVVPQRPTVEVPALDIAYTPVVQRRGMRWSRLRSRGQSALGRLDVPEDAFREALEEATATESPVSWSAWQRLGGNVPRFGHGGAGLRDAERHLEENPEWFALQADGTRDQGGIARWRLCKSNPELIAHVANDIIQRRNETPDLMLVSLCPNDGGYATWCMCESCKALDPPHGPQINMLVFERAGSSRRTSIEYVSLTDRMVYYWNSIAERVTQVHPDLLFGVSAYSRFTHPPVKHKLHPNLVVRYVPPDPDRWDGWVEAGAKRIYYRPNILLMNRRHGKFQSIVRRMARNMSYFAENGMYMTDFDSINHFWSTFGINYYATARLNWNPHLPADEIIADYAKHGFGAGAEHIERFFHRLEDLTEEGVASPTGRGGLPERDFTPEEIAELRDMLNAAEAAAAGDEQAVDRIAFLRIGLNLTDLYATLDDKARRAQKGENVDIDRARLLVDLNCLMLRDIMHNHNQAINVPALVSGTGTFAKWRPIRGRRVMPSDEALLERLDDPRHGLTGREDSVEDMLKAFGMEK
ncbi:MAG: DUF4838 domain-containing protein [Planctomycetota bacterium]